MKRETFILACFISCTLGTSDYRTSCPEPGDAEWIDRSNKMNCPSGTSYHCAKDYDKPFVEKSAMFIEACAEVKICKAGEEPSISLVRNEQHLKNTDADVYCVTCRDPNQYNNVANKATNMFTQCPLNKQHVCQSKENKINCSGETHMTDRLCRCDARRSYKPDDDDVGRCFEQSWIRCIKYTCPADKQLLLNYTCAPNCPVNYIRTNDSDDCIPTGTSAPEIISPPTSASTSSFSPISSTEAPNLTTDKHSAAEKPVLSKDVKIWISVITVVVLVFGGLVFVYCKCRKTSSSQISSTDLVVVSNAIGNNWELLAPYLSITDIQIEQIIRDHPNNTQRQIYYMLVKWSKSKGENATKTSLLGILKESCGVSISWTILNKHFNANDVACDAEVIPLMANSSLNTSDAQTAALPGNPNPGTTIINIHKKKATYIIDTMNKGETIYSYPRVNVDNGSAKTDSLIEESCTDTDASNTDSSNENIHDVVKNIEEKSEDPTTQIRERSWYKISEDQKNECMKNVLDITSSVLYEDLKADSVLNDCLSKKLLRFSEIRDIMELRITTAKNREIVQTVRRKDFDWYLDFKKCLHQTGQLKIIKVLHMAEDEEMHKYLKGQVFKCSDEVVPPRDQKHSQSNKNKTVDVSSHDPSRDVSTYNSLLDQLRPENVDELATALIPSEWHNKNMDYEYIALKSSSDGNCFFNSCSLMLKGDESLSQKLRQEVAEELEINSSRYCLNHHHIQRIIQCHEFSSDDILACYASMLNNNDLSLDTLCAAVRNEGHETREDHYCCSMLQLMAASTVLNREIVSLYPETKDFIYRDLYHAVIHPVIESAGLKFPDNCKLQQPIILLWSRHGDLSTVDEMYIPNHVVPVVGRTKRDPIHDIT